MSYNFYGRVKADEVFAAPGSVEQFVRWRVQLMERAIDLLDLGNGVDTISQVHDYKDVSFFTGSGVRQSSRTIITLFQDNYPEFLERKRAYCQGRCRGKWKETWES